MSQESLLEGGLLSWIEKEEEEEFVRVGRRAFLPEKQREPRRRV